MVVFGKVFGNARAHSGGRQRLPSSTAIEISSECGLRDPNRSADPNHSKVAATDRAAQRTRMASEALCRLRDRIINVVGKIDLFASLCHAERIIDHGGVKLQRKLLIANNLLTFGQCEYNFLKDCLKLQNCGWICD